METVEIKFRGRRHNKKWAYGYFVKNSKGEANIVSENGARYKVDPETVGQLVMKTPEGLDKYGKDVEVYVGDILEARCTFQYVDGYKGYNVNVGDRFVVACLESGYTLVPLDMYPNWNKQRIFCQCRLMTNWYIWNNHRYLVPIGNIFDRKSLVREEANYFM